MESQERVGGLFGERGIDFNTKLCASDGRRYLVSEAEEKDLRKLIESSCMHCSKVLASGEIKVVPPQSIQEQDHYVSSGAVSRRVLCTSCYEKMTSSTRERVRARYRQLGNSLRQRFLRSIANGTLR